MAEWDRKLVAYSRGREEQIMNDNPRPVVGRVDLCKPEQPQKPVLSFHIHAEIERLRKDPVWQNGRITKTLVKYPDFRVVLMGMQAQAIFQEHKSAGRISVEVISGHIQMHIGDTLTDLAAGTLVTLDREVLHDVKALENSAFLLTIALPEPAEKS